MSWQAQRQVMNPVAGTVSGTTARLPSFRRVGVGRAHHWSSSDRIAATSEGVATRQRRDAISRRLAGPARCGRSQVTTR
jgi:hypothetical protein